MKKTRATLLVLALITSPAWPHVDSVLKVAADGAIRDIPARFGPVSLTVENLGSANPLVQLKIGPNQTTLPPCVARMIKTRKRAGITAAGSWDHDESALPPYVLIEFFDPAYNPKRTFNSSQRFLFDLRTARLIAARAFEAKKTDDGGQFRPLSLPAGCKLDAEQ